MVGGKVLEENEAQTLESSTYAKPMANINSPKFANNNGRVGMLYAFFSTRNPNSNNRASNVGNEYSPMVRDVIEKQPF